MQITKVVLCCVYNISGNLITHDVYYRKFRTFEKIQKEQFYIINYKIWIIDSKNFVYLYKINLKILIFEKPKGIESFHWVLNFGIGLVCQIRAKL